MANKIEDIYTDIISSLPPTERLQLATLILNGLAKQQIRREINFVDDVDDSDVWTQEDQDDLALFAFQHGVAYFSQEEDETE
ncbi:MAG: hypothetical protein R6U67_02895 [Sodalinema sp.]|jgi:hypothetical protein|uniref:hypothetical protein n=1 Tax=Sodalinema sp. TaxID=3080550 RepID=UPI0007C33831|nr:hypothetical protein AY600_10020 [Phormidium willei BDU 130791]TAN83783.1 MAG: hypothetical protein EYR95_18285 [Phormidium sp. SL48-SHIP]